MINFVQESLLPRLRMIVICVCLLFVVSGCMPKRQAPGMSGYSKTGQEKYTADREEVVQEAYVPRDDGKPLSATELRAFKSVGQLDANLSQEDSRIVELYFKYFVHENRGTFERYLTRSARFLPYVKQVFAQRGLPEELAYLFMVESGGNPNAISPVGAAGLWQFMPYTGKKFGLAEQTSWYDERRDPFKATFAASDYLLKLYNDFGDWHLAAAAYNAGEGKIGRAVEGTGATDFFELCRLDCVLEEKARLRDETRQYVPRLIAIAKIMRNLRQLGFKEPSPSEAYVFDTVHVPPGTNLQALASKMNLSWDEFAAMNPAYRKTVSPPKQTTVAYVLPEQRRAALVWLASNEARMFAAKEYKVKKNDTLASISSRHKISVAALKEANKFSKLPKAGTTIVIPGVAVAAQDVPPTPLEKLARQEPAVAVAQSGKQDQRRIEQETSQPAAVASKGGVTTYVVSAGDTIHSLARAWGTTRGEIRAENNLKSDSLRLGQKLVVPAKSKIAVAMRDAAAKKGRGEQQFVTSSGARAPIATALATERKGALVASERTAAGSTAAPLKVDATYVMQAGDSLYKIAARYNIPVSTLCEFNNITDVSKVRVGQKLRIPGEGSIAAAGRKETVAVASRDTASSKSARGSKPVADVTPQVQSSAQTKSKPQGKASRATLVQVKKGDSIYSIAKAHNVSVEAVMKANGISPDNKIRVGQTLTIP